MAKTHLVRDSAQAAGSQQSFTTGAAIADLALGSTGIGAVDTVLAAAQTKINDVLAKMRDQGVIAP